MINQTTYEHEAALRRGALRIARAGYQVKLVGIWIEVQDPVHHCPPGSGGMLVVHHYRATMLAPDQVDGFLAARS